MQKYFSHTQPDYAALLRSYRVSYCRVTQYMGESFQEYSRIQDFEADFP